MSEPKVRGTVHVIEETKTYGQSGFRKRLVVLEQDKGRFVNYVPVEFVQDNCDTVDDLNVGDEVEIIGIAGEPREGQNRQPGALVAIGQPRAVGSGELEGLRAELNRVDPDLRMEIIAAYNLVVDSNIETPAGRTPTAFFASVRVCNDGTTDITDLFVRIGDDIGHEQSYRVGLSHLRTSPTDRAAGHSHGGGATPDLKPSQAAHQSNHKREHTAFNKSQHNVKNCQGFDGLCNICIRCQVKHQYSHHQAAQNCKYV